MTIETKSSRRRRVVANITLSLDGRVNGAAGDHDMGWLVPHAISDISRDHMIAVTAPATTVLLGRKNYEGFSGFWPSVADDESADPRDRTFATWLNDVDKVVISSTLGETDWSNSRVTDQTPRDVVDDLRGQDGGDIIVLSSVSVIRDLLDADAIDRLSITLCPVTVGGGQRLFDDAVAQAGAWMLVDHTVAATGALCLLYDRNR